MTDAFWCNVKLVVLATALTGLVGAALLLFIERIALRGATHAEIEQLFGNRYLMATSLAAAGAVIIVAGKQAQFDQCVPLNLQRSA